MKNFFIAFGVFLIWSFFGLWIYSWLQPEKDTAKLETIHTNKIPLDTSFIKNDSTKFTDVTSKLKESQNDTTNKVIPVEIDNLSGLKVNNEKGKLVFAIDQSISFKKNTPELSFSQSPENYLTTLNEYLIEHPEQELHINSLYSPKELVLTPNIGIQRAKVISRQLIKEGVPMENIVLKSIIRDIIFNKEGYYDNGIHFVFKPINESRIKLLKKEVLEPLIVYPGFSESGIAVNKDLKALLNELIIFFKNNPNNKIEIIGHTDNIGNSKDNYNIGLKYSKQVRQYLINKGKFNNSMIKASSKGESEPIDDNYSERGRIANRRIEVIFK